MTNEEIMRQAMLAQSTGQSPGIWGNIGAAGGWNNPLLNIGMGILAANKPGASFGQAVGGGGLLGMQNYQASQYQQARMDELQRKRAEEDRARRDREAALAGLPPDQAAMIRGFGVEGYTALNPAPSELMQGYLIAQAQGYPGTFMQYQQDLNASKATRVSQNVTQGGPMLSPGEKKVDEKFADQFVEYGAGGGAADAEKQIAQLREVYDRLGSGENLTGAQFAVVPESLQPLVMPESVGVKEAVEEVVQRNLRLILGAQFTEKEGIRLIARAYNPKLSEAENRRRIGRLLAAMQAAHESKRSAAEYFRENGTLKGWGGQLPRFSDFYLAVDTPLPNETVDFSELRRGRNR